MIRRSGRYMFKYTDGEKYKCYTCQHRDFRCDGQVDYCRMRSKILNFSKDDGCKSGWSRRYKQVH